MAVLNPRLWKANAEYGVTYSIDNSAQLLIIGYSQDYDVCKGKSTANSVNPNSNSFQSQTVNCRAYLNKSVETLCDQHKFERRMNQFNKFRAGRVAVMGDRVDINAINRMRKMQEQEQQELSFMRSDKNILNRTNNRPMPMLSPKSRAKKEELQKKVQN